MFCYMCAGLLFIFGQIGQIGQMNGQIASEIDEMVALPILLLDPHPRKNKQTEGLRTLSYACLLPEDKQMIPSDE